MENKRISYVEPIDAPAGKACRGCDMPNTVDNPVVLQGHAPDGRPLYGHSGCSSLMGSEEKTTALPTPIAGNLGLIPGYKEETEDIWAFATKSVFKIDQTQDEISTQLEKDTKEVPATTVDATQPYNSSGAPVMPKH